MQRTGRVTIASNNTRQKLYKCYINASGNRNLPDRLLEGRGLYELFSKYGDVIQISYKNGNNGIAFCFYESRESLNEASKHLNRKPIDGVKISVREAECDSYYEKTYNKRIVIKNIQEDVSEQMLKAHLERYGKVSSIQRKPGTNNYEVIFADLMGVNKYIQLGNIYSIDDEEIRKIAENEIGYSVKLEDDSKSINYNILKTTISKNNLYPAWKNKKLTDNIQTSTEKVNLSLCTANEAIEIEGKNAELKICTINEPIEIEGKNVELKICTVNEPIEIERKNAELKICTVNEPIEIEGKTSEFSMITTAILGSSLVFGLLLSAHSLITKMRNKK